MNTFKLILFAFASFLFLETSAQSSEEALNYLKNISGSLDGFRSETWSVLKSTVQSRSSSELDWKIQSLASNIETARTAINKTDGFYGDLSAKVAMTVYLRTSHQILTEDFKEIKKLEKRSEESFETMEKYLMAQNKANERLNNAGGRLDDELKRFAKRYKIEVTEEKGPLAKKIEKSSLALGYYNQVYLSYFKSYKQKLTVYEALKSEDIAVINDEINLLNEYSSESLGRLMILDGFMEDNSLSNAAIAILQQFKLETETTFPHALKAIEKKQIFNLAQQVFESIPEGEKTQSDVDHLNSLIDPLNQAIDTQNQEFSKSDKKRVELFNVWNREIIAFFATYLS